MRQYECRKCNAVYYGETNHNSEPSDFQIKIVKSCKKPLTRQVTEAILIKNHVEDLLNSKSEGYQPPIVQVRREVVRGLHWQCGIKTNYFFL